MPLNSSASSAIPTAAIGVDPTGRTRIDWGVYGVPETFVIGKDGKIAFKHVGPLTGRGEGRIDAADRKGAGGQVADAPVIFDRVCFAEGFSFIFVFLRQPESQRLRGHIDARQCRVLIFCVVLVVIMRRSGLS